MPDQNQTTAAPRPRRKRKNYSLLILAAGIFLFGVAAGTIYYLLRPVTLRVAVGPPGSDDLKLIQLLGRFNDVKSNRILRKLLVSHDNYVKINAIKALLKNKQPLDPALFLPIAADIDNRLALYRTLKETGKPALFPATYRTQRMFGESLVYQQAIDDQDGDATPKVTFIATRLTDRGGKKKKVYFYKIRFPETGDVYLGCAGLYDMDPARLDPDETIAQVAYFETLDPAHVNARINKLLKDFEEAQ